MLWRPLAEQGSTGAQYNLGSMYANGKGVTQNNNEAMKWYRLAAAQGDTSAALNLGLMYMNMETERFRIIEKRRDGTYLLQNMVMAEPMWRPEKVERLSHGRSPLRFGTRDRSVPFPARIALPYRFGLSVGTCLP
jgi:TPR repeat protein